MSECLRQQSHITRRYCTFLHYCSVALFIGMVDDLMSVGVSRVRVFTTCEQLLCRRLSKRTLAAAIPPSSPNIMRAKKREAVRVAGELNWLSALFDFECSSCWLYASSDKK